MLALLEHEARCYVLNPLDSSYVTDLYFLYVTDLYPS